MMKDFKFSNDISKPMILKKIENLCQRLQTRQLVGSHSTALETIKLLREVIASAKFNSFDQLCIHLTEVGKLLLEMAPKEFAIENMVKRVILLLKEEYASALETYLDPQNLSTSSNKDPNKSLSTISNSSSTQHLSSSLNQVDDHVLRLLGQNHSRLQSFETSPSSLSSLSSSSVEFSPSSRIDQASPFSKNDQKKSLKERDFSSKSFNLKPIFIEAVQELYDELELVREAVAAQAPEHIHSGEVIMTYDNSRTVKSFLRSAAKNKRSFSVIVSETSPNFSGRELARSLSDSKPSISTIMISDSSSFGLMSRCTKLLIGCHIVFGDGSILARSGTLGLALAAKSNLVPVIVVCGIYKFSNVYLRAGQEESIRDFKNPDQVLIRSDLLGGSQNNFSNTNVNDYDDDGSLEVLNPYYDRVPADLISLFITNLGGHPSSFVYRLLKDLYGQT